MSVMKYAVNFEVHGENLGNSAVLFKTIARAKKYAKLFTSPPMRNGKVTIYSLTKISDGSTLNDPSSEG